MPELAVSSWSLHRELGPMYWDPKAPDQTWGEGRLTLLDAPAVVAQMGVPNLEVCHFHFPRTDPEYLAELRARLDDAGVRFLTLLIDTGDLTASDSDARQRDMEIIRGWIEVAAQAGAAQVRVIAGDAEPDADGVALQRSIAGLGELAAYADSLGVRVITENWHQLTMRPEHLLTVLNALHGTVGLCADFGNYKGSTKYDDLRAILPRANTIHAKADFPEPGVLDREDFGRCLELARTAGFDGQYVLIFDSPGEEVPSLRQIAAEVTPYL